MLPPSTPVKQTPTTTLSKDRWNSNSLQLTFQFVCRRSDCINLCFFSRLSVWLFLCASLPESELPEYWCQHRNHQTCCYHFSAKLGEGGDAAKLHGEVTFPRAIRQTHGVGSSDSTSASTELKLNAISSHMILSSVLAWWRSVKINSSLCFQSQAPPNFGPVQEDACEEN